MKKFLLTLVAVVALTAASKAMVVWAEEMAASAPEAMTNEVAMNNETMNDMNAMDNETNAMSNETNAAAAAEETTGAPSGTTQY